MLSDKLSEVPTGTSGVYCLFDIDGRPAYGGKSGKLRDRLRQHFIRQDSSVVSYGRLDIWDISHLQWWIADDYDSAEYYLLGHYTPYLNFLNEQITLAQPPPIELEDPDGLVRLISDDERAFRSQPYNRTKQKLDHLSRMVDKIKLAGHSDDTKRTLYIHHQILQENMNEFLDIDESVSSATIGDFY